LRREGVLAGLCALALCVVPQGRTSTPAQQEPSNFQESTVISGLDSPTQVRFAPGGQVFVAEKSGVILEYPSLDDPTPTVFADLSADVDDYWDRGLLSIALDPSFPAKPYVYALFTFDAPIGGTPPVWGDDCPTPPGPTTYGCVVSGRLVRLTADESLQHASSEQVLLDGWCQQFPSHSIGDLQFGSDGSLYVSGGEGANFYGIDYGQYGDPVNPCGDPPVPVGGDQSPPGAEGGALRSQSLLRSAGEPAVLNGSILRVDPSTGAAMPDNPLAASADPNARRIVAQGLRNPFRFTMRPGTDELWVGDVGWNDWEEVNRILSGSDATVDNFGWPCYEGAAPQPAYQSAGLRICSQLYATPGAVKAPYYAYNHNAQVVQGETCASGSSSISGLAFYEGGSYPAAYDGALFIADYSRNCIWALMPGPNGLPDSANIQTFDAPAAAPVDLEIGPGGDLFYVDLTGGTIRRIRYFAGDAPPDAVATASATSGAAPLTVNFDGSASSDPDAGDSITSYAWDLDGDGQFDDSTAAKPTYTYGPGTYTVRLQVTDSHGYSSTSDPITISSGNDPPVPVISSPVASKKWKVGDPIAFSGSASDAQDGALPAASLTWTVILHHCPSNCHTHVVQSFHGVSSGSFSAPDHDYPSYLELQLKATDSDGLSATTSVDLLPQTTTLSFDSVPRGLKLAVGSSQGTTPFTRTVIANSTNAISAPLSQTLGDHGLGFVSWSDDRAATHTIVAPPGGASFSARYRDAVPPSVAIMSPGSGRKVRGRVVIRAVASDDTGVTGVRLTLDGARLGPVLKRAPYTLRWATAALPIGPHVLRATATDAAGNTTTSAPVQVRVYNPARRPPPLLALLKRLFTR